ncbi:hypothetical protein [Agromyces sp. Marseille-Q5079]|uniref:hypothetical protein n=1 Tax=Agromyces sp. Marseille-Q5079 TaxID=3439059 RepID=UPI003D9CB89F
MTTTLRTFAATAAAALLLTLTACAASAPAPTEATSASPTAEAGTDSGACAGVEVVVELAELDLPDSPAGTTCVETDAPIAASEALAEAGITTEGTTEYGDQVVCRVNGVPAEDFALTADDGSDYFETCESMPAAFAYWGLWTKPVDGEWGYAQEGLSTLQLQPGEGLALLFTVNDEPAAPSA